MIELDTQAIPATADQWTRLIDRAVRRQVAGLGPTPVTIDGQPPRFARLVVDLTGGVVTSDRPPVARAAGGLTDGPAVDAIQLSAHPITVHGVSADLELSATGVTFSTGKSAAGNLVVAAKSLADGSLKFSVTKRQLEAGILAAAKTATASAGVEIKAVDLQLKSVDCRTVDLLLSITVKKFMTAVVRVSGRFSVDDKMVGSATGLKVDGDGMAGSIAAGFIRPVLPKIHDTRISLQSVGGLTVRDLSVTTTDGLQLDAKFGGNP